MTSITSQAGADDRGYIRALDIDRPVLVFKIFLVLLPLVILFATDMVGYALLLLVCALPLDARFRRGFGRPGYQLILSSVGLMLLWAVLSQAWSPLGANPVLLRLIFLCVVGSLAIVSAAGMTSAQKAGIRSFILLFLAVSALGLTLMVFVPQGIEARWAGSGLMKEGAFQMSSAHAVSLLVVLVWPVTGVIFSKQSGLSGRRASLLGGVLVSSVALLAFRQEEAAYLLALALGGATFLCVVFQPRLSLMALASLVLGYLLLAPIVHMEFPGGSAIPERATAEEGWASRMEIWSRTAKATFDAPITGKGFDAAIAAGPAPMGETRGDQAEQGVVAPPYNLFLRLWFDLGLVGVLLMAGVLFGVFSAIWSHLRNRLEAGIAAAVLVSFLTFSLLSSAAWQMWWVATAWMAAVTVILSRQSGTLAASPVRLQAGTPRAGGDVVAQITYTAADAASATKTA